MKRFIEVETFLEALEPYEVPIRHLGLVLWRVGTETLGQRPYGQPEDGPLNKVIFTSSEKGKNWFAIHLRGERSGFWFELVGGPLVPEGSWYQLKQGQPEKSGEVWVQIHPSRMPTPDEVAEMGRMIAEVHGKWLSGGGGPR